MQPNTATTTVGNMFERSAIRLSHLYPTYEVIVIGTETTINIYSDVPRGAESFDVRGSRGVDVFIVYNSRTVRKPMKDEKWPLDKGVKVRMSVSEISKSKNDVKVKVSYYGAHGKDLLRSAMVYVTAVAVSLDVDVNRVGAVTRGVCRKDTWTWGPGGKGAIVLVNCDRDRSDSGVSDNMDAGEPNPSDVKDMSPMSLTAEGPVEIFVDHKVILEVSSSDSKKLRVYRKGKLGYKHVLGAGKVAYEVPRKNRDDMSFFVEGLQFPDVNFPGLLNITLRFQRITDWMDVFIEKVTFRVAPWIMTPNTQKPIEVFVCNVKTNDDFVKSLSEFVKKSRAPLTVCQYKDNQGDRWIQDEMEFGYTEAPHKKLPVVFDSPRDRGLKNFPCKQVLGPDFGYVTREVAETSTLDAFGNLEVSPPVTADGKDYPLGRILYGGSLTKSGEQMTEVVTQFLNAQLVQSPIRLFSTWLLVGHIDEFMSFVPANDKKGFRLLLASPRACLELFSQKQKEGHGKAIMFEGAKSDHYTIDEILADKSLKRASEFSQDCIDTNRKILKKKLGLTDAEIIDIPQLYTYDMSNEQVEGYFPNMVNMLVLGNHLAIPKPFGPRIGGQCCLEARARSLLEPLGLSCTFLDDFSTYHKNCGDIHCGTNVVRKPFDFKWWECEP
ncbi:protein-arginine deiminase type-1-like [Gastrophryne carolinensis]